MQLTLVDGDHPKLEGPDKFAQGTHIHHMPHLVRILLGNKKRVGQKKRGQRLFNDLIVKQLESLSSVYRGDLCKEQMVPVDHSLGQEILGPSGVSSTESPRPSSLVTVPNQQRKVYFSYEITLPGSCCLSYKITLPKLPFCGTFWDFHPVGGQREEESFGEQY